MPFFEIGMKMDLFQSCGHCCAARKSYPTSEVWGSGLKCQAAMVQERLRGATLHPKSGAAAERSYPASEVSGGREELPRVRGQGWRPGVETPASKVRGGQEKPPRT